MPDPLDPNIPDPPRSLFGSFLHWVDRPGQAVRATLSGKPGRAARELLDLVDQPLTLGLAPEAAPSSEDISWGALGDIATNPLTLLSLKDHHLLQHAATAAKAGAKAVGADQHLDRAATTARRTLGWLDMTDEQRDRLGRAKAAGGTASKVGQLEVERVLGHLPANERTAVGEILHGIDRSDPERKNWKLIPGDVSARTAALLASRPHLDAKRVSDAITGYGNFAKTQFIEGVRKGVFRPGPGATDYLPRRFNDKNGPNALSEREFKDAAEMLAHIHANPEADLEFDALKAAAPRAAQQGTLEKKALLLRESTGNPAATLPDDGEAMAAIIEHAKKETPDYGYALENVYKGIPPRNDVFFKGLHAANKIFKPAATYGVVLPRISFHVRNQLSEFGQVASDEQARKVLPQAVMRSLSNLLGAFDDGYKHLTGSRLGNGELTQHLDMVENAMRAAKGNATKALAAIDVADPRVAEAIRHGVLDGWVSSEEMIKAANRSPNAKLWRKIYDLPAVIGQGLEQRMRLGKYLDLRRMAKPLNAQTAAKAVRDSSYDYDVVGKANRNFRDVIPFGAYAAAAIKQQGQLIARYPGIAVALGAIMGDHSGLPKYNWMQQQTSVPFGLDEQKNPQYLTGLGLPFEALNDVPGPNGASLEHLIGQSHPLLKTAYSLAAGHDPEFGTQTGSYDRDPLTHQHSEVGRVYNELAATGLLAPADAPLRQVGLWTDERKSGLEKALQFGTGLRFASVDPELAEQEQLREVLGQDPSVFKHETFMSDDPSTKALIREMEQSRKRLKEKREQIGAMSP